VTTATTRELAETLTAQIVAIPGVQGIFPHHTLGAAVLAVVTASRPASGLIDIDDRDTEVRVTARLATTRTISTPEVIEQVRQVVADSMSPRPFTLHIEFAHID
jgi:hypothetical protein